MNRQQKRKLDRENEENTKNYGFSNKERNAIANCVKKITHGLSCVGSIKPLTTIAQVKYDNFIGFRIGLAVDMAYTIECGTDYILKRLNVLPTVF